jgi:hypothetical protein
MTTEQRPSAERRSQALAGSIPPFLRQIRLALATAEMGRQYASRAHASEVCLGSNFAARLRPGERPVAAHTGSSGLDRQWTGKRQEPDLQATAIGLPPPAPIRPFG